MKSEMKPIKKVECSGVPLIEVRGEVTYSRTTRIYNEPTLVLKVEGFGRFLLWRQDFPASIQVGNRIIGFCNSAEEQYVRLEVYQRINEQGQILEEGDRDNKLCNIIREEQNAT